MGEVGAAWHRYRNEHIRDPRQAVCPGGGGLQPSTEVTVGLCRDCPGAPQDKDKTPSDFRVKLGAVTPFTKSQTGSWILFNDIFNLQESWEMDFVH